MRAEGLPIEASRIAGPDRGPGAKPPSEPRLDVAEPSRHAEHHPILDGLRGVAALAVMLMHAGVLFGPKVVAHSMWLTTVFTATHLKTTLPPSALVAAACLVAAASSGGALIAYDQPVRRFLQKRWLYQEF